MPKRVISWFHAMVDIELDNLTDYISAMDMAIEQGKDKLQECFDQDIAKYGEESREHIIDLYVDEGWQWDEPFRQMLWTSYFVASYSYLEHLMARMCIHVSSDAQFNAWRERHKRDRGSVISKNRRYLEDEGHIDLTDQETEWQEIDLWFREARNAVTHAGGEIDRDELSGKGVDPNDLVRFITSRGGTVDSRDTIIVSREFCSHFSDDLAKFISKLLQKLPPDV